MTVFLFYHKNDVTSWMTGYGHQGLGKGCHKIATIYMHQNNPLIIKLMTQPD